MEHVVSLALSVDMEGRQETKRVCSSGGKRLGIRRAGIRLVFVGIRGHFLGFRGIRVGVGHMFCRMYHWEVWVEVTLV